MTGVLVLLIASNVEAQRGIFEAAAPRPVCETVRGNRCQFPFIYKGKQFDKCTNFDTSNGAAWCAYEVQDDRNAVPGKWEDCDTSVCVSEDICQVVSGPAKGNSCKFPFKFRGKTYNSCAPYMWKGDHYGKYWCSTKTDRFDNHVNGQGHIGFCGFCKQPACGCGGCQNSGFGGIDARGSNKPDFKISFAEAVAGNEEEVEDEGAVPN